MNEKILFIDIETVSQVSEFRDLSETDQAFWTRKSNAWLRLEEPDREERIAQLYKDKAAIFAEFGKIICISIGFIGKSKDDEDQTIRIKSFYGHDEKDILTQFFDLISTKFKDIQDYAFCGHNIKEFDIPYICRRALVHGLSLPGPLEIRGKKPWEVKHLIDTLEEWKFGDFKHYTSLALLAHLFQIPTPKDDIDGSMVGQVYWEEQDLERIRTYCQKDVVTVARIYYKLIGKEYPAGETIHIID